MCPRAHRNLRIRLLWTSVALCSWLEPRCQIAAPIARRAGSLSFLACRASLRRPGGSGAGELAR